MRGPSALLVLLSVAALAGCTSSPHSQDFVRRSTAAVTRTVASDVKGAALGIRDGLRHDPSKDPVDVNHATRETLAALPGLSGPVADRIIAGRPYRRPKELVQRRILTSKAYGAVSSRLVAH